LLFTNWRVAQLEELQEVVKKLGLNSQDLDFKTENHTDCWD
jgi:hypothetical protein